MLAIFAMPYLYLRLSPIISGYILIHYTKRTMETLCLCIHVYLARFPHFYSINMNVKWYRNILPSDSDKNKVQCNPLFSW